MNEDVGRAVGFDPSLVEWHGRELIPPHVGPVLAEYYPYNSPTNAVAYHVVWYWDDEWRPYPKTEGESYVNRWSYLPSTTPLVPPIKDTLHE